MALNCNARVCWPWRHGAHTVTADRGGLSVAGWSGTLTWWTVLSISNKNCEIGSWKVDSDDRYRGGSSMDRGACSGPGSVTDLPGDAWALEGSLLCSLDSLEGLARWRDGVIDLHRQMILGASAMPDVASCARNGGGSREAHPVAISAREALAAGIDRMRENGELAVDADPTRLATGLAAALQGGSLLAKTTRDITPLEAALDLALSYVRSHSAR